MENMEKNLLEEYLDAHFEQVLPKEFYRDIFPAGELEIKGEQVHGKYNAIALCIDSKEKFFNEQKKREEFKRHRIIVTDDLDAIDEMTNSDNFCLLAPVSFAGKTRHEVNARNMYALAIDLDHLRFIERDGRKVPVGLANLWEGHILAAKRLPKPTYIVSSGTGLHLYYVFDRPVPMFDNVRKQLRTLKHELTFMIWNEGIVEIKDERDIQYESIVQGFRVPGTITKRGSRAQAYRTGEKVSLEYLNEFVRPQFRVTEFAYKSELPLARAKELYPEWYQERIVEGKERIRHPWAVNRALYDWWRGQILFNAKVGHRYYCMMILAVYARKCSQYDAKKNPNPVTQEELEKDAYELMEYFETLTKSDDNHFSASDVLDALEAYDTGMLTYPRNSIEYHAGFEIPKNKRNKRKQAVHLGRARAVQNFDDPEGAWRNKNGRPKGTGTKAQQVYEWREAHPLGTKANCIRDTKLSKHTVLKWWEWTPYRY